MTTGMLAVDLVFQQLPADLVAGRPGQLVVQEDQLRLHGAGQLQALLGIRGHRDPVAGLRQVAFDSSTAP